MSVLDDQIREVVKTIAEAAPNPPTLDDDTIRSMPSTRRIGGPVMAIVSFAVVIGLFVGAGFLFGGQDQTPATDATQPPSPDATQAPSPDTTQPSTTDSTYPVEVVQFAEASGLSLAEAAEILEGQMSQNQGYERLLGLVGEGIIVEAAFHEDYARADELTLFVVDEQAVALVEDRLAEAGLDPAKTTVEVAPETPPEDPFDWLDAEPFLGHDWLDSPGPHIWGAWQLVESNNASPQVPVLAGFGTRWSVEACPTWLGDLLTTADGSVTVTVYDDSLDCGESTDTVEELIVDVVVESEGDFEVGFQNGVMTWTGAVGSDLVWQMDDSINSGPPVYPPNRSEALEAWSESPAPDMEGTWHLLQVGTEEPAAPVSLDIGVSTMGFDGLCNDLQGLFAISTDSQVAMSLASTDMACSDATGDVEAQLDQTLGENRYMLRVFVEDDVMTWSGQTGSQVVWSR